MPLKNLDHNVGFTSFFHHMNFLQASAVVICLTLTSFAVISIALGCRPLKYGGTR